MRKLLFLIILALISPGCREKEELSLEIHRKKALPGVNHSFLKAGMIAVDITPPPGLPMGGYSEMGNYGQGFRTRLKARVLYLKPARGPAVALVQTDLVSGSRLLHHRVAELIAARTDVDSAGLLVLGSHSHSTPGNFLASRFFNTWLSNDKGFEKNFFKFLSNRIADAVVEAYETRRHAKIGIGTAEIFGVTYNRSYGAYLNNKTVKSLKPDKIPDIYHAVNPVLHMIRVDVRDKDGKFKPLGAFSHFSIHPVVIPPDNIFYNADVFAYVQRELEWGVKQYYRTPWHPVHATANFTHGDNNPVHEKEVREGFKYAGLIGKRIGRRALKLFLSLDGQLKENVPVRFTVRELDLRKNRSINEIEICERPVIGVSQPTGARDRSTPIIKYLPFFRPGWPRWFFTGSCQGRKRWLLSLGQYLYFDIEEFPRDLFIQTIQIGDSTILALPFEVTTEMGKRLAARAAQGARSAGVSRPGRYIVTSLANGYSGYVTTEEEYERQYYEGGSNLYGPRTGQFLGEHLFQMSEELARNKPVPAIYPRSSFNLRHISYLQEDMAPGGRRKTGGGPTFIQMDPDQENYWSYIWFDVPPARIQLHRPLIEIEVQDATGRWTLLTRNQRPENDSQYNIALRFLAEDYEKRMGVYEVRWYNPPAGKGKKYRFRIRPRGPFKNFVSPEFDSR